MFGHHDVAPVTATDRGEWLHRIDACIVHQNVYWSELVSDSLDKSIDTRGVSNVAWSGQMRWPSLLE